tara:strand:- start:2636 stop:3577 length:942 start_codon:yes stop_codon:yes gene_type:complete
MNNIIIYSHQECLKKFNGSNHPENKERLQIILDSIKDINRIDIELKDAPIANINDIVLTHPKEFINEIFSKIPKKGIVSIEKEPFADTFLCPSSKNSILRSAGSGIAASDQMIENTKINKFFCAVRPPGHHAETIRANGFCFLNNIAITANYLIKKYKFKKIAIIDFDVHHGNGTQEIFYNNPNIMYCSMHEFPLFPGTGSKNEIGVGNIVNIPIQAGTSSTEYINLFKNELLIKLKLFQPEVLLISAGFDAHTRDPLAHINLESKDFYTITKMLVNIANLYSKGRIISFLEGGYDLLALKEGFINHITALGE